jgi:hypothetical protein
MPHEENLRNEAHQLSTKALPLASNPKARSLESSKCKRKTSEQISNVELQAASGLAQMSRKKLKKAVKKVASSGVR